MDGGEAAKGLASEAALRISSFLRAADRLLAVGVVPAFLPVSQQTVLPVCDCTRCLQNRKFLLQVRKTLLAASKQAAKACFGPAGHSAKEQ
uniref:Secreted protein n=1 Tax=Panagrellus redivivus TaxID=6233 RepID=A0A7E4VCL5_PANRE